MLRVFRNLSQKKEKIGFLEFNPEGEIMVNMVLKISHRPGILQFS